MSIIQDALKNGQSALSEYQSKQLLAGYGIPVTREILIKEEKDLCPAARRIGYPVVIKGCAPDIAHKTDKGLIRTDVRDDDEAKTAYRDIVCRMEGNKAAVLVQEMIRGKRELAAGLSRDTQFGPSVMFGLGGIFTEILDDVSFRVAPLTKQDALQMMREIKGHKILDAFRGMDAADPLKLAQVLVTLGNIGMENHQIQEIDINPLIISGSDPVAVDALVVLA